MIRRAVRIAGSQARLARALAISQPRVSQLCKQVEQCSAEIAVAIEQATAGEIPRWHMRPDLFDMPKGAKPPPADLYDPSARAA
ncbi:transcriptional regulator [Methylobacterium hispanicum]|uniref:transcriptional regulator n=1 Tax=Methylobacterium hispanicum TaxID=270350 RepID=UPI001AEC812E